MQCRNCGSILAESSNSCTHCGFNMWQKPQMFEKPVYRENIDYRSLFGEEKNKKFRKIKSTAIIAVSIFISFSLFIYAINSGLIGSQQKVTGASVADEKYKICPDAWIKSNSKEFFVISGEKISLEEFDVSWVKENCNLKIIEIK